MSRVPLPLRLLAATALAAVVATDRLAAQTPRPLRLDDHSRLLTIDDPQRSPDGAVGGVHGVAPIDVDKDKRDTDVWMARWDGSAQLRLTTSPDNETSPRWSPDGKYLAFLASRGSEDEKKKGAQLWLLNAPGRRGAEGQRGPGRRWPTSPGRPTARGWRFVMTDVNPADEPEKMPGWKRKTDAADRHRPLSLQGRPRPAT